MATAAEIEAARVAEARAAGPGPGPGPYTAGTDLYGTDPRVSRTVHPAVRDAVAGATLAMKNAADFIGRMKTTQDLPSDTEVAALVKDLNNSSGALNDAVAPPNPKHLGDQ